MPSYEFRCTHCGTRSTLRRLLSEWDEPVKSLCCGADMERQFSPTQNIHVPLHFRQVLAGGAEGPGQLSWSDFHEESERELAKNPNIEKAETWFSQSGTGRKTDEQSRKRSRKTDGKAQSGS